MKLLNKICILLVSFLLAACGNNPQLIPLPHNAVIVAFGDSLTYGTGATPETSYPADLEKITGLKVINSGVPGEETRQGLARISEVLSTYHPQLVILCLGGNDFLHNLPHQKVKENLRQIIQKIQNTGAQVILVGVPRPSINLHVPDFYEELGQELNVPVDKDILTQLLRTPEYKSDVIHLNAAGYKVLAQNIGDFLIKTGAIAQK